MAHAAVLGNGHDLKVLSVTCGGNLNGIPATITRHCHHEHSQIFEVSAPKLESFCLSGHNDDFVNLREVNLPSLARARVRLEFWWCSKEEVAMVVSFVRLVRGMYNAKPLDIWIEDKFRNREDSRFNELRPLVREEVSRFVRLKNWKIRYSFKDQ